MLGPGLLAANMSSTTNARLVDSTAMVTSRERNEAAQNMHRRHRAKYLVGHTALKRLQHGTGKRDAQP